jgi:hypothetical protein
VGAVVDEEASQDHGAMIAPRTPQEHSS